MKEKERDGFIKFAFGVMFISCCVIICSVGIFVYDVIQAVDYFEEICTDAGYEKFERKWDKAYCYTEKDGFISERSDMIHYEGILL